MVTRKFRHKYNSSPKNRTSAQAMVVVFVFMCVISLTAININSYAHNLHRLVIRDINHLRAWNAAESGLVLWLSQLVRSVFPVPVGTGAGISAGTVNFLLPDLTNMSLAVAGEMQVSVVVNVSSVGGGSPFWIVEGVVTNWR